MTKMFVRLVPAICLLLTGTVHSQAQIYPSPQGSIQSQYDKFTDDVTVGLMQLQVAEKQSDLDDQRLYLTVLTQYHTRPKDIPDEVTLVFSSWSLWNNRYTDEVRLDSIIDGERKSFGAVRPLGREVIKGKYVASLGIRISGQDFFRLVKAKTVEMRLGDVEFTLSDHAFQMLRAFVTRITP
jgi:hypothetical protein